MLAINEDRRHPPTGRGTILGGIDREEWHKAQEAFLHDPGVQVLVATDTAGEGINLQRAHLMMNDDLPWNRSRIERCFGHIYRTGQPVRFSEVHANGNDTGGKARSDILKWGQESNCAHLVALEEERGYPRNGHRSVRGDPFHHDAFQDLRADYIPIQFAL